ncbi:hypothetical protein FB567DRAFT_598598 [Paraphoma chrysanthemicola]|uniref:Uncharacterized protein n=1 Tax=Paraphoma chrysanthemicola TaxID=798071 RepID=A0A8K0QT94_9PLEO|nr:hypothetical protein FB567DRAFT_598598 [Paraphoma chrysanthemicola]
MTEPPDLETLRLAHRRHLRGLVIQTFDHQHPVKDSEPEASRKLLERIVSLHKACRMARLEIESVDLPNVKIALRQGTAQLRRCRKPRSRVHQESRLRLTVSSLICVEWDLYQAQKAQEDSYDKYLRISESYAQLSCRQVCERMQLKLPLELRDMIYKHMVGSGSVVLAPSSSCQLNRATLSRHYDLDLRSPPPRVEYPGVWLDRQTAASQHIFNFSFVGFDTLSELVEHWYRATTFITSDFSLLEEFLSADPWFLCIHTPQLLRRVVIQISESAVRTLANKVHTSRRNGQDHVYVDIVPGRDNMALVSQLAHLNVFKPHTKAVLHIVPGPDYTRFNTFGLLPVDVWNKHNIALKTLLEGLHLVWRALETLEQFGRDAELCLDAEGQCVLNKHNAVWSPLGWLATTMEFGYEQDEKLKAASRNSG